MLNEMLQLFTDRWSFFAELLLQHLAISCAAILIAIILGGCAGILISEIEHLAKPTMTVVNFLYTIPSISMLGFLIPFSGVGNGTAIIALTIYALLPMVRSTYTGLSSIAPALLKAAVGMGSTQRQLLWRIKLPLAMPIILSGIRSMATMTIALAGIASFIGAGGLGVAIYRGITTNNAAMTLCGSLLIAFLALIIDALLGLLERHISHRHHRRKAHHRWPFVALTLLFLVGIGTMLFQYQEKDTIHIATKPMTEQAILGEMLAMLIEQDTDLTVELTQGVGGGTANIQPAMEKGEFDLYPEYTGTAWNQVLKESDIYHEELFPTLRQAYLNDYDMEWVGMYGFNNTYGLVVRQDIADKYQLTTYSDLTAIADQLVFGAEYDFFERADGYDALCNTYDLHFAKTMDLDIGLKYQALAEGDIDVMVVFTTDGQLADANAKLLEDDKQFYPSYLCGNVVRSEVLRQHPELRSTLEKIQNRITDNDMAAMNNAVENEGRDPHDVAEDFLRTQNLLH